MKRTTTHLNELISKITVERQANPKLLKEARYATVIIKPSQSENRKCEGEIKVKGAAHGTQANSANGMAAS